MGLELNSQKIPQTKGSSRKEEFTAMHHVITHEASGKLQNSHENYKIYMNTVFILKVQVFDSAPTKE